MDDFRNNRNTRGGDRVGLRRALELLFLGGFLLSSNKFVMKNITIDAVIHSTNNIQYTEANQPFRPILWTKKNTPNGSISLISQHVEELFRHHNQTVKEDAFLEHLWLKEYIQWHSDIRMKFFDNELLENPNAPNVSIYLNCCIGGLNDRFKNLDTALYNAFLNKRILLIHWYDCAALDTFLMPNVINWTVPSNFNNVIFSSRPCRNLNTQEIQDMSGRIVLRSPGVYLKLKLTQAAYSNDAMSYSWHALFRPSPLLQSNLNKVFRKLGITPGYFDAAHCRVRHPAHLKHSGPGLNPEDHGGANYTGNQRLLAIKTAIRAIQCTDWISDSNRTEYPIYFYSDSEQLVDSVIRKDEPKDDAEAHLHNITSRFNVVARSNGSPIAHIGDMKNRSSEYYLPTFIDLYVAASAKCLAMGVGNFAYLAARVSGTTCLTTHDSLPKRQRGRWGMKRSVQTVRCEIPNIP